MKGTRLTGLKLLGRPVRLKDGKLGKVIRVDECLGASNPEKWSPQQYTIEGDGFTVILERQDFEASEDIKPKLVLKRGGQCLEIPLTGGDSFELQHYYSDLLWRERHGTSAQSFPDRTKTSLSSGVTIETNRARAIYGDLGLEAIEIEL